MSKKRDMAKMQDEFLSNIAIEDYCDYDGDAAASAMGSVLEVASQQLKVAADLTKLIVNSSQDKSFDKDKIFSIFKEATQVVSESYSGARLMKEMMD